MDSLNNQTLNILNDNYPNHVLYTQYKNAGPNSTFIGLSLLLNAIGVFGIASNLLLIFVTIRDKNLRGPTNYLLALTAFFEILHQSGHFLFLAISISGINLIDYSTAIKFQLHSIFGLAAAQTIMCSTAADRLLSVLFPIKYNQLNIRPYLLVHTLLAFSSGIWMSINAINLSNKYPTLPVTGRVGDLLVLDMEIMLKFIMLLCAFNVIFYVLVWVVVRCFYPSNSDIGVESDSQSRLLKSLVLIITIVIGGFVINSVCRLIVNRFFNLNDIQNWYVSVLGGLFLNIGASAETPTLYIFSSVYHKSINKQLKYLFCKKSQNNVISVVPYIHNNNSSKEGMIGNKLSNKNILNKQIIIKNCVNNSLTKNIKY
uniref:G-protein coupled receptors family 1 profile domain-containing protein n=1 Tax=Meloidogyne enterolobii TaxID=390850 RepID=A0A6V7XJQ8_MELEN|nr:unnamed protein product [Meloidogyne enterolobii]